MVEYPRADRDWEQGSTWVGNGAVVGQQGGHRHDDNDVMVVLHDAGHAPPWARHQVLTWGRWVQVWVWAGAPARWGWDNGDDIFVFTFVIDKGGRPRGCSIGTGG